MGNYIYQIGYGSCEESQYFELESPNKYNREQLEEIMIRAWKYAVIEKAKEMRDEFDWWTRRGNFEDMMLYKLTYQNCLDFAIEFLVEEMGFKEIEYEQIYSVFGWNDILKNDWDSYSSEKENTISKVFSTDPDIEREIKTLKEKFDNLKNKDQV